jgi:hypothetical protein
LFACLLDCLFDCLIVHCAADDEDLLQLRARDGPMRVYRGRCDVRTLKKI